MKFQQNFTRKLFMDSSKSVETTLGRDVIPLQEQPSELSQELLLQLRPANINGFPVQRIVVGMHGPKLSSVRVAVYVRDDNTGFWFRTTEDDTVIYTGCLAYIDLPVVACLNSKSSDGAIEAYIRVVPESVVAGEYVIVAGGDVSNPG